MIVLRRSRPDLKRPFRVPLMPVIPILSALASLWLMLNLQTTTWIRFGVWMVVGLVVYFAYSVRSSRLARGEEPVGEPVPVSERAPVAR